MPRRMRRLSDVLANVGLDDMELVSAACHHFCRGRSATEIRELLMEEHGIKIRRERAYKLIAFAASQGWLRFAPPEEYRLQQLIRDQIPELKDVRVVHTAVMEDVAVAGATVLLRLLQAAFRQSPSRQVLHVGFAGGYTMREVARRLAALLREPVEDLPAVVVFHAIVAGFDLYDPTTDPNAFFSFLVNDPAMRIETRFVGLHAPAMVKAAQFRALRDTYGVKEAFDHVKEIDVLVTSASSVDDPHGILQHYEKISAGSGSEIAKQGCAGDMLWRPISPAGPLESRAGVRAMTILELSDVSRLIQQGKNVLLVAGPCGECGMLKTEVVKAILAQQQSVITHLVVDSRCARQLVRGWDEPLHESREDPL